MDGVYVLGMPWLYTWGSGRFVGVGRDAGHIAEHVAAHLTSASACERSMRFADSTA
jgi:putative flavoprotein involved in K+ transport